MSTARRSAPVVRSETGVPERTLLEQLVALDQACFGGAAWSSGSWRATTARRGVSLIWLDSGPVLEGFAVVARAADEAELLKIAVARSRRKRGLGGQLLTAAIDGARGAGQERLHLELSEDNAVALRLYLSHGFVQVGRRTAYYRDGSDALLLTLQLRQEQPS